MAKLIVNADDYGMHPGINQGILHAIDHGCVNSVSVVSTMVCETSMQELLSRNVRIGVHIILVDVPWSTSSYFFKDWSQLFISMLTKGFPTIKEIEVETTYQISRMKRYVPRIAHIDSHQHTHTHGSIWKLFKQLALENDIVRIRNPHAPSLRSVPLDIGAIGLYVLSLLNSTKGIETIPCIGIPSAGDKGGNLQTIQKQLAWYQGQDIELVMHPAVSSKGLIEQFGHWKISWDNQLTMLCADTLRRSISLNGFNLNL
ncbi:MAG: ChbG/HpnK family deacetylase [Flavobacteriales bacterium]|nr:ChbG/HpnK family deacetylase [Flavobacteriales bacterium]